MQKTLLKSLTYSAWYSSTNVNLKIYLGGGGAGGGGVGGGGLGLLRISSDGDGRMPGGKNQTPKKSHAKFPSLENFQK